MSSSSPLASEPRAKVAIVGSSGVGKASMVRALGRVYAHDSVCASDLGEARVFRTEFFWPQELPDGRRLRVGVYAISGPADYNAVQELLLSGAAGVVFVASLARAHRDQARVAYEALLFNARHHGMDLGRVPMALHYRRSAPGAMLEPEELGQVLGELPEGARRFVTEGGDERDLRAPVEWVVAELVGRGKDGGTSPAGQQPAAEPIRA